MTEELGAPAWTGEHTILTGSCSWTDKTLVEDAEWYPRRTMSAEERLRYYAAQFPLTEIDSTYYAPPAERQVALWAERVPEGFRFDVKAYSLLTGHPTRPRSLWRDLREGLDPEVAEKRNVYPKHLGPEAMDEAWRRFEAALRPLHEAGKLGRGAVPVPALVRPPARQPGGDRSAARADAGLPDQRRVPLAALAGRRARSRAYARHARGPRSGVRFAWTRPRCRSCPRLLAVTNPELFIVRFHGRSDSTWNDTSRSAAERFSYLYSEDELEELVAPIAEHAAEARETHLLMNNCYRDYSVRNADQVRDLLARYAG